MGSWKSQVHNCITYYKFLSLQACSLFMSYSNNRFETQIYCDLGRFWFTDLGKTPPFLRCIPTFHRTSVVTNCRTFYGYILGHQIWGCTSKRRSREVRSLWNSPRYYPAYETFQLKHFHGHPVFFFRSQLGKVYKNPWESLQFMLGTSESSKNALEKNIKFAPKVHPRDLEFAISPASHVSKIV